MEAELEGMFTFLQREATDQVQSKASAKAAGRRVRFGGEDAKEEQGEEEETKEESASDSDSDDDWIPPPPPLELFPGEKTEGKGDPPFSYSCFSLFVSSSFSLFR